MKKFNPLDYPISLMVPTRNSPSFSSGHSPFEMTLIELLRPNVFVELGTYEGMAYCAFCQAIAHLRLPTQAYAVGTWKGELPYGENGPSVLEDLKALHDPRYGSFSRLIQASCAEAVQHFPDGSIDLLHLDGRHIDAAVGLDFTTWLPKMSPRGVVTLHDIDSRADQFEVWKLWHEIKDQFPSFDLFYQHGLGVVVVGQEMPEALRPLIDSIGEERVAIREYYFHLGQRITAQWERASLENRLVESQARHEVQVADQRTSYEAQLADQRASQETQVAAVRVSHEAQVVEMRARHEAQLLEQHARHEAELAGYQARIEKIEAAHAGEQASSAALRSRLAEAQQSLQEGRVQLEEKSTRLETLHAEVVALWNQWRDQEAQAGSLAAALRELEGRYQQLHIHASRAQASARSFQAALAQTHAALAWRVAHWLSRCSRRLAPAGTRRRRALGTARRAARVVRRSSVKRFFSQATARLWQLLW